MEMTGEQHVPVEQAQTWRALNDIDVLKASIPGCESIEKISDQEFVVAMTAKIGPVSAKFKGKMTLSDLDPPNGYSIAFEGQGGVAGFAKGQAQVSLLPEGSQTLLRYTAKATVGGKLAQIGSRLIDGAAKKMADQFFTAFNSHVSGASL
jgi:carbon monoxide dehydrogenase subunit G